ncbi:MAG: hypothetical protein F4Y82_00925 [Cenarchaeum sp. SB0665_bin_23]|nr:hypothetical protein [Cenarchaeum sp. SB0667_bin_13]MXY60668.1 hypothetical protein [Cenarchaeum sp. SB0665_bin_23]MYC79981.1 hypothetical protein [Cenarchaeum sp. SB0661_bin_35]MYG32449.1 hypothetical protein [Cenarchaeum sp. SB0677_bin_16]
MRAYEATDSEIDMETLEELRVYRCKIDVCTVCGMVRAVDACSREYVTIISAITVAHTGSL